MFAREHNHRFCCYCLRLLSVLHSELSSFNIPKIQELVVRRPPGRHITVPEPLPFIIITAEQVELVIGMEAFFPVLPILYCVVRTLRYPKIRVFSTVTLSQTLD